MRLRREVDLAISLVMLSLIEYCILDKEAGLIRLFNGKEAVLIYDIPNKVVYLKQGEEKGVTTEEVIKKYWELTGTKRISSEMRNKNPRKKKKKKHIKKPIKEIKEVEKEKSEEMDLFEDFKNGQRVEKKSAFANSRNKPKPVLNNKEELEPMVLEEKRLGEKGFFTRVASEVQRLEQESITYRICDADIGHINLYKGGKVVISYWATSRKVYVPITQTHRRGIEEAIVLYKTIPS